MTGLTALWTAVYGLALVCFPDAGAQAAAQGLALCGRVLLPALFPWLVLAHLLVGLGAGERLGKALSPVMGPMFHAPGAGAAALALGALGGYPTGAAVVRSLLDQETIDVREAEGLLCFCCNAGPAFALSVAGAAVFGDLRSGAALLAVHLLSALLTGLLLRPAQTPRSVNRSPKGKDIPAAALLTTALGRALESSLHICACVVFFQVLTGLLETALPLGRLPVSLHALVTGALELSGGVCALTGQRTVTALAVAAFLLGWGGCSVHCQVAALMAGSGVSLAPYLRGKLLQGLLSAALVLGLGRTLSPLLAAGAGGGMAGLFPVSVPLGWVIWAVTALTLLRRDRPCNCPGT